VGILQDIVHPISINTSEQQQEEEMQQQQGPVE